MNNKFIKSACLLFALLALGIQVVIAENTQGQSNNNGNQASQNAQKPVLKNVVYKYKYNKVPIKQPVVTQSMKPGVAMYNQGNYLGAMLEFEKVVSKEPNNIYALYYYAVCCMQLGRIKDAEMLFNLIITTIDVQGATNISSNGFYALKKYSEAAKVCIESHGVVCTLPKTKTVHAPEIIEPTQIDLVPPDEITQFIRSGKKISPKALDKITNERMQRKIQADIYAQQQLLKEESAKK